MCPYTYGGYTGTIVLYWYDLLVYGTRFPMEHLTFFYIIWYFYTLWMLIRLCTCPFVVTVPLLWTSTTLIRSCTQTLQLCFYISPVLVRVRDLYVIFMQDSAHVHFCQFADFHFLFVYCIYYTFMYVDSLIYAQSTTIWLVGNIPYWTSIELAKPP